MTVNVEKLRETWEILKKNLEFWSQGTYIWRKDFGDDFWSPPAVEDYPNKSYTTWSYEVLPEVYVNPLAEGNECKTAYCFAGFVGLANGFPRPTVQMTMTGNWWNPGTGESIAQFAKDVLGLSSTQADELFDGDNELEHLEFMVDYLTENPDSSDERFMEALRNFIEDHPRGGDYDDWEDSDDDYDEDEE